MSPRGCTCPLDGAWYCDTCQHFARLSGLTLSPPGRETPVVQDRTEAEVARKLWAYCDQAGLLAYHTYNAKRSAPGFPDWVIVHPAHPTPTLFCWELKREDARAQPGPAQRRWLEALGRVTRVHVWLFRPSDWRTMLTLLEAERQPRGPGDGAPDAGPEYTPH